MIFTNPLIDMPQAAAEMSELEEFVTKEFNAPFSLTLQATFPSFANEFLLNNTVVSTVYAFQPWGTRIESWYNSQSAALS